MKRSAKSTFGRYALSLLLSITLLFSTLGQVYGNTENPVSNLKQASNELLLAEVQAAIEGASKFTLGLGGINDWQAVGLSKADKLLPASYVSGLHGTLLAKKGTFSLVTDYERIVIGLTAANQDASKFAGYNLIEGIYNNTKMTNQGINGLLYALIALDSGNYTVPNTALWTRDMLVSTIVARQKDDGGFALGTGKSDPDLTGMTLTALAPYAAQAGVGNSVDKAVNWLSINQTPSGGYLSWGADASESVSQAIIGLTSHGIDPTESRFTKDGGNLVQKLLTFRKGNGAFSHTPTGGSNSLATEQALQALVAYDSFNKGKKRLYDFGDRQAYEVSLQVEGPDGPITEGDLNGTYVLETLERLLNNSNIPFRAADSSSGKLVASINNIDAGKYGGTDGWKYAVYRDGRWLFPATSLSVYPLSTDDKVVIYYSGDDTQLAHSIQVMPAEPAVGEPFKVWVQKASKSGNGPEGVVVPAAGVQVKIGSVTLDTYAGGEAVFSSGIDAIGNYTIEVSGYKGDTAPRLVRARKSLTIKEAPIVTPGEPSPSPTAPPGNGGGEPSPSPSAPPGNGGGEPEPSPSVPPNNGGGQPEPPTAPPVEVPTGNYATISVTGDSQKGMILGSKQAVLQAGDTAFSILERELPGKIRYIGSGSSLYIQEIDGLSEFDRGSESGWMYSVNGVFPEYSAGEYVLKPNDRVAWRYTLNLGADFGQVPGGAAPVPATPPGAVPALKQTVVDVPRNLQQDYVLHLSKQQRDTEQFTLNIPEETRKIILDVENAKEGLPKLTANKGDFTFEIDKGTKLKAGDNSMELFTGMDVQDSRLSGLVQNGLADNEEMEKVSHAFIMGSVDKPFLFDKLLTLKIKGGKGQLAGFIEGDKFSPIKLYESDDQGLQATKGEGEKITYAYVSGSDLVIKTNHFTTFVTYTTRSKNEEDSSTSIDLGQSYSDADQISAWALESMKAAIQNEFVQGSGGKLTPKTNITRAEFTRLMVSMLGLKAAIGESSSFKDVPQEAWFAPYVGAAHRAGFITGYQSQFKPHDTISREQMAVMMIRALDVQSSSSTSAIKDLNRVSPWAKTAVQASVSLQLMIGQGNEFKPSGSVTREMAAVVVMRAFDYKKSAPDDSAKPNNKEQIAQQIALTAAFLQKSVPNPDVSTLGGEWTVLGLARSGIEIPDSYFAKYYANLEKELKEKSGVLHSNKYTEYSRAILALASIGKSTENIAGYNLLDKLADFDAIIKQGINGPIFALIALDSKQYDIPSTVEVKTRTTRDLLVDFILKRQLEGGGWVLGELQKEADPDVTAMAIQSLAPYYHLNNKVQGAVDKAVTWLSSVQRADGGFASNKTVNSESAAQVIVALTSIGINPQTDHRFIKNGNSPIGALLGFAASDGGFYHIGGVNKVDAMATDQAMYAMVAYNRLLNGQTRLYDLSDNES
ncbi:S-layer homology domain-containing protein [Paenibacillus herberti]|uniref:S-layer protein n=1 Tax=Paenibacillus herberti TaxID=1619309 RepID=A0A229P610_9BACL|nr:S-layer homology domain-containing protein [Paenibacillus herberti]OXM17365.1 S-layer protein [Paenibacillus herberti]